PVAVVMVALPALVSLTNCRKLLLVMLALPAVLKKTNLMSPLLMMVTSPPPMPAPLKASGKVLGTVKVYAGAPALNANPPTVVLAENDRLVTFDGAKTRCRSAPWPASSWRRY